jgi:transposase
MRLKALFFIMGKIGFNLLGEKSPAFMRGLNRYSARQTYKRVIDYSNYRNKENKTLNHSLQNTGSMGRFARFLTYKAKKIGKRIIEIDESDTTKTCYNCGKKENRKLSDRVIHCDCGNVIGRDKNSAVNIMLRFLSHQPPRERGALETEVSRWLASTHSSTRYRSRGRLDGSPAIHGGVVHKYR